MITNSIFLNILFSVPPFVFAIVCHEVAHAYIANKLGDPTAKSLGRITLNPLKHIDFFMSILLPGILILSNSPIIFGGAKPVPVNPGYFKNPKRDMAIVAAAGPITNFIIAYAAFHIYALISPYSIDLLSTKIIEIWLIYSLIINVALGLFNLIPVPPLDGGRIMVGILPTPLARFWAKLERFGLIIVILLLTMDIPQKILNPGIEFVTRELSKKIGMIEPSIKEDGKKDENNKQLKKERPKIKKAPSEELEFT